MNLCNLNKKIYRVIEKCQTLCLRYYFGKLIVVTIDLVILILIQVKANDIAFTSLCHSLVQNTLPYPLERDNVQDTFYISLLNEINLCEEKHKGAYDLFTRCVIIISFETCMWSHTHT